MTAESQSKSPKRTSPNRVLESTSFLYGSNAAFIEGLYAQYVSNPDSVDGTWRAFFDALGEEGLKPAQIGQGPSWRPDNSHAAEPNELLSALTGDWGAKAEKRPAASVPVRGAADGKASIRAFQLIRAYRMIGHLEARLDPLELEKRKPLPQLQPSFYGFQNEDLDRPVFIDGIMGFETVTPRELVAILRRTYCGTIGYEYMHITDPEQREWLQRRIEGPENKIVFTREGKRAILNKLIESEIFEKFCGVKFVGTKRFGLDGAEATIPAMEQIIKRGGALGVKDIVLGMPHRGRLNMLVNVMSKPYRQLFHEFQGGTAKPSDVQGSGDVKYHLGASSDRAFDGNNVHLSLTANPSHLEAVDPVVLGKARAKQSQLGDKVNRTSVLPLLLHGDAAFAGQGVVAECFAMSGTKGFRTGGTIHFIVNNQLGFTTAPAYARSSPYPSDVALMVQAPIFHVNGDDPEAVVHCAKIATEFRQLFRKDVVVDMFCYRRFGHNEGDEPAFTQPLMYRAIRSHPTTLDIYSNMPAVTAGGAAVAIACVHDGGPGNGRPRHSSQTCPSRKSDAAGHISRKLCSVCTTRAPLPARGVIRGGRHQRKRVVKVRDLDLLALHDCLDLLIRIVVPKRLARQLQLAEIRHRVVMNVEDGHRVAVRAASRPRRRRPDLRRPVADNNCEPPECS